MRAMQKVGVSDPYTIISTAWIGLQSNLVWLGSELLYLHGLSIRWPGSVQFFDGISS